MQTVHSFGTDLPSAVPGYDVAAVATRHMLRAMSEWSHETARFVSDRLEKDAALQSDLARCDDPMELMDCWTRFMGTAMADYSRQAQVAQDLFSRSMQKTYEDMQGPLGLAKAPIFE